MYTVFDKNNNGKIYCDNKLFADQPYSHEFLSFINGIS